MKERSNLTPVAAMLTLLIAVNGTVAATVKDLVKLDGHGGMRLIGLGLVVGLHGTGDGYFEPTKQIVRSVFRSMPGLHKSEEFKDLESVAVVGIIAQLPPTGACAGDRADVTVFSFGAATSLKGGRLFPAPLMRPEGDAPVAKAAGLILIEDAEMPTSALVKSGAVLEADVMTADTAGQKIRLILNETPPTPQLATVIARSINDRQGIELAAVVDKRTVSVKIPEKEQSRPQPFIQRVLEVEVPRPK